MNCGVARWQVVFLVNDGMGRSLTLISRGIALCRKGRPLIAQAILNCLAQIPGLA